MHPVRRDARKFVEARQAGIDFELLAKAYRKRGLNLGGEIRHRAAPCVNCCLPRYRGVEDDGSNRTKNKSAWEGGEMNPVLRRDNLPRS
jgi:hypothetical protein